MLTKYFIAFISVFILTFSNSCQSNKIPCPTYADSQPQKKSKKGKQEPQIPRATKPKSGLLPPNAKHK